VAAAVAAVPSVVNIDVSGDKVPGGQNGLPDSHRDVPMRGNGSGVAFKKVPSGGTYILTNNHVVEDATDLTVADASGKIYEGVLVGGDPDSDIAVVRIEKDLPVVDTGDSSKLLVGQVVVAIGSPFGFEHSVTSGVVSALGRSLYSVGDGTAPGASFPLADVIQTDAAINPGNSGGALVDRTGRLVGINAAIYSGTGQSGGIGFAIPVDTAARVAEEIIAGGTVSHPFIGLIGSTVDAAGAAQKKLPVKQGALVESLSPGAGAQKAGMKVGDVVVGVDDADVRSMEDLIIQVRRHAIGETIKLKVRRGDKTVILSVIVGDKPADFEMPSIDTSPSPDE
jgi:S1-C subfamily serine protease